VEPGEFNLIGCIHYQGFGYKSRCFFNQVFFRINRQHKIFQCGQRDVVGALGYNGGI